MFELIGKVSPETGIWEHISNIKFVEDSFKSTKNRSVVPLDISKNTQTLILTIFSGAIATYEDS